jgi:hypothetical protein
MSDVSAEQRKAEVVAAAYANQVFRKDLARMVRLLARNAPYLAPPGELAHEYGLDRLGGVSLCERRADRLVEELPELGVAGGRYSRRRVQRYSCPATGVALDDAPRCQLEVGTMDRVEIDAPA